MNKNSLLLQNLSNEERILVNSEVEKNKKSTLIAWLLWWFFGTIGGHRYYFGKTGSAIAMTLITVLTFGFGLVITVIWAIVDAFFILSWLKNDQEHVESVAIEQVSNNKNITEKNTTMTSELKELKELLDSDAITQEEFDTKKKQLLNL